MAPLTSVECETPDETFGSAMGSNTRVVTR